MENTVTAKKAPKRAGVARGYFQVMLTADNARAELDTLREVLEKEKGVPISAAMAIMLAVREATAARKGGKARG